MNDPVPDYRGTDFDQNLYWGSQGQDAYHWNGTMALKDWQLHGQDTCSFFADPLFVDPAAGNFTLQAKSPAVLEPIGTVLRCPCRFSAGGLWLCGCGAWVWLFLPRLIWS